MHVKTYEIDNPNKNNSLDFKINLRGVSSLEFKNTLTKKNACLIIFNTPKKNITIKILLNKSNSIL